ncbi:hypothetical protein SAMN05518845_11663 [Variovorax sp. YR750]|nr:hypothetical protein SAMN05518845_11663 [Variovorax sp. YR750]
MDNLVNLSNADGGVPTMTMDEFERRANEYVHIAIRNLRSSDVTRDQYKVNDSLKADLWGSFHRIMSRHYALIEPDTQAS